MTTIKNDFNPGSDAAKTLVLEDFASDTLTLTHYIESIDTDGFNVDITVEEAGEASTFTLTQGDAEALLSALCSVLLAPVGE